jgi:2-methylcitrate dehydratase
MSQTAAQWDATTECLVEFAERSNYDALPAATVHECKRRLIDTFASAIGAYDEPPARMARAIASRSRGDIEASVWGSNIRTTPEAAAFANGVMVRLLDISDTYLGKSRGHPSDMTSGILAAAEAAGADGKSIINAIVLAYDVYCSFCQANDINSKGWDQPVYSVLGCVLGAGKLLGLTREQMGNAVSLALAPNMALAQSRRGNLSIWKGCAGANASRNAVFAATLAKEGFTGPPAVFEGEGGLRDIIGPFDWPLPEGSHMIGETHMKSLPVCYHGQSAVLAALELRPRLNIEKIEDIQVDVYRTAVIMMGAEPSRWAPETRETADHSLPYCVAMALLDGEVTNASFADARLHETAVARLMRKVKVSEDPKLSAAYPEAPSGRVSIRMMSGEVHTREVTYPAGHAKNPMTDADVERKFRGMLSGHRSAQQSDAALEALWNFEQASDIRSVLALLAG